jgi:hypothetical protein
LETITYPEGALCMANISITDSSAAIVDATILDTSLLGKTPASALRFLRSDVIGALNQTVDKVQINSLALGFSYQPSFPVAGGSAKFTGGGSLTGEIDLYQPAAGASSPLFATDQFGTDIEMKGNVYAALSLQLSVGADVGGAPGAFTLTLANSASATAKVYLPFGPDSTGAFPTLKSCLETLLNSYKLPSSVNDFDSWPVGTVFTFDCQGSVAFNGSFDVLAAINPTATPGVSSTTGPITISAGPSVTIGGGFTLSGEFQVRIWKQDGGVLQLGYYKKRGTSFSVTFDASAGVDVGVGGFDAIAKIYALLGDKGKLDADWLKANVPAPVADDVSTAYKNAVQTKLSIAIDAECDSSITDQVAFSWNFDMKVAEGVAQSAFLSALQGNLTPLLNGSALPAGVTKMGSVFDHTTDVKHTFTFNFLGLFDHASVEEAVVDLNTKISADGQLIMTDQAHLTRLSADATPFVKTAPLQKVFAEDCAATVGYAASFGDFLPSLQVQYSYYNFLNKAKVSDLSLFIDTATQVLNVNHRGDWLDALQSGASSGPASFLATLSYDSPHATALFLDGSGAPRSISDFEFVGRQALLLTPGLGLNPVFQQALADNDQWAALVDAGSANNVFEQLGVDIASPPAWAQLAFDWSVHVQFWASAMHSAGQALQAVSQYVKDHPGADLLDDGKFQNRRQTFASQLKNAIQKTPMFNDSLGLISMVQASTPVGKSVTITYGGKTEKY